MGVKAQASQTIVDLSDGFSVSLSQDSASWNGGTSTLGTAQTVQITVSAYQGANAAASFSIGTCECSDSENCTATVSGATVTVNVAAAATRGGSVNIPVTITSNGSSVVINKTFSYSIALKGSTGAAPYAILVGNEAQVISCDKNGLTTEAGTITIPFSIFQGTTRRAATVSYSTLPSGITVASNTPGTASAEGSLVLDIASGSNLGGADNGTITLTFKYGTTTVGTKTFTWSKAIAGQQGVQGEKGTAATSVVCGNESASIPCTLGGLVTAAMTITIPFAGYIGTARAACTVAVSGLPSGITAGTNTAATASADGSLTLNVAKNGTLGAAATLSGQFTLTFTCNGQTFVKKFAWAKAMAGAQGDKGDEGDPALVLVITADTTVLKNNTGTATLTAHVYYGGEECSISNAGVVTLNGETIGTVKWYASAVSGAGTASKTYSVTAATITNTMTCYATLED